jgi:predicted negative regulator of RcsB-dependent stress response
MTPWADEIQVKGGLWRLSRYLWDVAWDLWDHRNNVVHKKDDGVLHQQLQHDIQELVNLGSSTVTAQARPLLRQRLAVLLTARKEFQKAWLLRVANARARFMRRLAEVSGGYH